MRGIYVEVVAWAPDQQSWTIYADYLDGATTEADDGAFAELTKIYLREWPDATGSNGALTRSDRLRLSHRRRLRVDAPASGAKATKGVDGWGKVPLGTATDQDVDYRGRKHAEAAPSCGSLGPGR